MRPSADVEESMMERDRILAIPPWEITEPDRAAPGGGPSSDLAFFVSYTREDLPWAEWVVEQLQGVGYRVEYQRRDFRPGGEFQREIDARIIDADRVIAVVSSHSVKKPWCRREWDAAGNKLLPVRFERIDVRGLLGNRTYVDVFGRGMDEATRRDVLLNAVAGEQPPAIAVGLPSSVDLPRRPLRFSGRDLDLKQIYSHFFDVTGQRARRRLTLTGMNGVGKTTLAIEFAHRMIEHELYDDAYFVRADEPESLEAGLREMIADFRAPRRDQELATQIREVLGRQEGWLLIIDHAPELDSIRAFLPSSGTGQILITSENAASWGSSNLMRIRGWIREEAVKFLIDETGRREPEDYRAAEELAGELDGNPDILTRAASYIFQTGCSIEHYLRLHRAREVQVSDRDTANLAMALERLGRSPFALELLRLASVLAPERIPVDLLTEGLRASGQDIDSVRFDRDAVAPLIDFSLAQRDDPHLIFKRLVQREVRASIEERNELGQWLRAATIALDRLFPDFDQLSDPAVWPRTAELLTHVLVVTEGARTSNVELAVVGRLMSRAAVFLETAHYLPSDHDAIGRRGQQAAPSYEAAATTERLLLDARRVLVQAHGGDHVDLSETMAQLGQFYRARGRLDEAEAILIEACEMAQRLEGPRSTGAAMRLTQLARVRRDAGQIQVARSSLEQAVEIALAAGEKGRDVLAEALASLGIALSYEGRQREALERLERSVELTEERFGVDHLEVAITLRSLAAVRAEYGDTEGAQQAVDRVVDIECTAYGDASPLRADGLLASAAMALRSNDPERAATIAAEAFELVGGAQVPDDRIAATCYLLQAKADRALGGTRWRALFDEAAKTFVAAGLPALEPRLALIEVFVEDGQVDEAASLASQLVSELTAAGDWRGAAVASLAQAAVHVDAGDLTQAERTCRSLLDLLERHPDVAPSLASQAHLRLGTTLRALHRPDDALEAFDAARDAAALTGNELDRAATRMEGGEVLLNRGQADEASEALDEALELRADHLIAGHPLVVQTRIALARAKAASGKEGEAQILLDTAVADTAARAGARSADVAQVYMQVADILAMLGRDREAANRAEEALRIGIEVATRPTEVVASTVAAGRVMLSIGDLDRASQLAASARQLSGDITDADRVAHAWAAEFAAHAALANGDVEAAQMIADELVEAIEADPSISARLKASVWLLYADLREDDLDLALDGVQKAASLQVDALNMPRREIDLLLAQLKWQRDDNAEAAAIAEDLLRAEVDEPFRLSVHCVFIPSLIDAGREEKAARVLEEVRPLLEGAGDHVGSALLHVRASGAYANRGLREEAAGSMTAATAALDAAVAAGEVADLTLVASLVEDLAGVASFLQDYPAELELLGQAAALYRREDARMELVRVMNMLAAAALRSGERCVTADWVARVRDGIQDLPMDEATLIVEHNLGILYTELGDYVLARDALEHALVGFENIRQTESPDTSLLLAPLLVVCDELSDFDAAEQYAERAVACNLLDDEVWDPNIFDRLLMLAERRALDDRRFDVLTRMLRRLAERRLDAAGMGWLLWTVARMRAAARMDVDEVGWDGRAKALADDARQQVSNAEGDPGVLADLAILQAEGLVEQGEVIEAERTLTAVRDGLEGCEDRQSLVSVLVQLGHLYRHEDVSQPAKAVEAFAKALDVESALPVEEALLFQHILLRTWLGQANLAAGARLEGIGELRGAATQLEAHELADEAELVDALCRLAVALATDAEDRLRAEGVLAKAKTINATLTGADRPQTEALATVVAAVHTIQGVDEAVALVRPAVTLDPADQGALDALVTLVIEAEMSADNALDLVAEPTAPEHTALSALALAACFEYLKRDADAQQVLRRIIGRLEQEETTWSGDQLSLLMALAALDETPDQGEARRVLEDALAFAADDPHLGHYLDPIRVLLGLALATAGMWEEAVETLAAVDQLDAGPAEVLAAGRLELGQHAAAMEQLSLIAAKWPEPWVFDNLAEAETASGSYQVALDTLGDALARFGPLPDTLLGCALICSEIAEYEASIRYAEAVLILDPDNAAAQGFKAWSLEQLGRVQGEELEAEFQRMLDLSSDESRRLYALSGRADARQMQGRTADARADYLRVLDELEPGGNVSLEGWAHYCLGDYDRAIATFEQAMEATEWSTSDWFDLALCQIAAGKPDGIETYRQALASMGDRKPRARLAPLRVARNDLRDAALVHEHLTSDEAFQTAVADVDASLSETEALVVSPILPEIPALGYTTAE